LFVRRIVHPTVICTIAGENLKLLMATFFDVTVELVGFGATVGVVADVVLVVVSTVPVLLTGVVVGVVVFV